MEFIAYVGALCAGHTGVCLKLAVDGDKLPNKGDILEPIRYSSHHPKIHTFDFEDATDAWNTYLLTKSVDWLYEGGVFSVVKTGGVVSGSIG